MIYKTRSRSHVAALATLLVTLSATAVAGCFSERVTTAPPTGEDLCLGSQPNVVRIRNFSFQPALLRVQAGTEVTFVNCDTDMHTTTADNDSFDSGLMSRYVVYTRTFNAVGSTPYHCEPHPFMTGAVVVE